MKYENVPLGDTLPPGPLLRAAARGEGQGDPGQCRGPHRSSGGPRQQHAGGRTFMTHQEYLNIEIFLPSTSP